MSTLPINEIESVVAFPKSIVLPFTTKLPATVTSPVVTKALVLTTSKYPVPVTPMPPLTWKAPDVVLVESTPDVTANPGV